MDLMSPSLRDSLSCYPSCRSSLAARAQTLCVKCLCLAKITLAWQKPSKRIQASYSTGRTKQSNLQYRPMFGIGSKIYAQELNMRLSVEKIWTGSSALSLKDRMVRN